MRPPSSLLPRPSRPSLSRPRPRPAPPLLAPPLLAPPRPCFAFGRGGALCARPRRGGGAPSLSQWAPAGRAGRSTVAGVTRVRPRPTGPGLWRAAACGWSGNPGVCLPRSRDAQVEPAAEAGPHTRTRAAAALELPGAPQVREPRPAPTGLLWSQPKVSGSSQPQVWETATLILSFLTALQQPGVPLSLQSLIPCLW